MGAPAFLPCVAIGSASVVRPGCFVSRQPPNFVRPATYRKKRSSSIVLCLAQSATDSSESEEGVVLDENAMRAAEIHEVLVGLEDFKARIVEDATRLAKKVRAPKKQLESSLEKHPDILKINGHIDQLQEELKNLGDR